MNELLRAITTGVTAVPRLMGPSPMFYSRLQRSAEALPPLMKADSLVNALKRYPEGVSQVEMNWSGVPEFVKERAGRVVAKPELLRHLEENVPRVAIHRDADAYKGYVLTPGNDKYMMTMIKDETPHFRRTGMRSPEYNEYYSSHFDMPNVAVHTRTTDRNLGNIGKTKFIDELQSDWHQHGRKVGYTELENQQKYKAARDRYAKIKEEIDLQQRPLLKELRDLGVGRVQGEKGLTAEEILGVLEGTHADKSVATFVEGPDGLRWLEDMLNYSLSWAPQPHGGQKQRISQNIGKLDKLRKALTTKELQELYKNRKKMSSLMEEIHSGSVLPSPFSDEWGNIGLKEAIHRAAAEGSPGIAWIKGNDIARVVGGEVEGQRAFYDSQIKNAVKKILEGKGDRKVNIREQRMVGTSSVREPAWYESPEVRNAFSDMVMRRFDGTNLQAWAKQLEVSEQKLANLLLNGDVYEFRDAISSRANKELRNLAGMAGKDVDDYARDLMAEIQNNTTQLSGDTWDTTAHFANISPEVRGRILREGFPLL